MNRTVARIEFQRGMAYYQRLVKLAISEALHRWLLTFGAAAGFTILAVLLGANALRSLLVFGIVGLIFLAWFLLTIPPRIEFEVEKEEETLRLLSERRNLANQLRSHMVECQRSAVKARAVAIEDGHRGATPDTFHQVALLAVEDATERLARFSKQTGQPPHDHHIVELTSAVSTEQCASFEDAIAQLEALADVIERQLASADYY